MTEPSTASYWWIGPLTLLVVYVLTLVVFLSGQGTVRKSRRRSRRRRALSTTSSSSSSSSSDECPPPRPPVPPPPQPSPPCTLSVGNHSFSQTGGGSPPVLTNVLVTNAIAVVAGSSVYVAIQISDATVAVLSVMDTSGNVYSFVISTSTASTLNAEIWKTDAVSSSGALQLTITTDGPANIIAEVAEIRTTGSNILIDSSDGNVGTSVSRSSLTLTTTQTANELLFVGTGFNTTTQRLDPISPPGTGLVEGSMLPVPPGQTIEGAAVGFITPSIGTYTVQVEMVPGTSTPVDFVSVGVALYCTM